LGGAWKYIIIPIPKICNYFDSSFMDEIEIENLQLGVDVNGIFSVMCEHCANRFQLLKFTSLIT